ncbi:Uncharacterised protein [Mycobacteroides abscessus subsp. abscessus]|nr:Uncharacterised protein [Mycobacteroides abscessus subsp. abscessus]
MQRDINAGKLGGEPVHLLIDCGRFPPGIGEHRSIQTRQRAIARHERQHRRLDTSA